MLNSPHCQTKLNIFRLWTKQDIRGRPWETLNQTTNRLIEKILHIAQWLCTMNMETSLVICYSILRRSNRRVTPRLQAATHRQLSPLCRFSGCVNPSPPRERSSPAAPTEARSSPRRADPGSPPPASRSLLSAWSPGRLQLPASPSRARSRRSVRSARTSVAPVPCWSASAVRS